ncbi:DUF533 domain-containing protein [Rhodospirillaceae bacterium SYSU D60014]|uniref:tellurite resistance TerB family protein n=1 Tax=Virgifigura deserti TaxID=2268457 RepID=UPI000E65F2D8
MLDAKRLLDQFLGSQAGRGLAEKTGGGFDPSQLGDLARNLGDGLGSGSFGGGALAGGLAGILLGSKKGRKLGGSALKIGGLALVGALAYKAYQDWQAGKRPMAASAPQSDAVLPPPGDTPFNPSTESEQQSLGRHLLRAMIAAAKADGHIDAEEQANIFAEMDKLDLDADDKAFVMDELRARLDVDAVAKAARTPEEAAEIYTASLLAIDIDNAAERGYLALLAARLKLDDALVEHLHATVEGATEKV